jgi:CxxC motif-containing protein
MEKRELTCIGCPLGCQVTVTMDNNEVVDVTGNTCPRGDKYAREEVTNPTRVVTSIVRVDGGNLAAVSVKTQDVIPKGKIFETLEAIKPVVVKAPIKIGDVIVPNVADTGIDVIATKNITAV